MLALLMVLASRTVPPPVLAPTITQQQSPTVRLGGSKIVHVDSAGEQGEPCLARSVARGASIVAVGTYEGGLPTDILATDQGHVVRAVSIAAARSGPPLVLVMSAYDPVVWDLRRVPKSRIRAVFVSGYHVQSVAGSQGRPVRITTYVEPNPRCGPPRYAYKGGAQLDALNAAVRDMLGRGIDRFTGGYALKNVALDRIALPRQTLPPVSAARATGGSGYKVGRAVDGRFGLGRLIAQGAVRKATLADVAILNRILTRNSQTGRLAPVHAPVYLDETFVVLRRIAIPSGMFGANSATFLIPRGVPFPSDPGSHNAYWSLVTGECRGAVCRTDD